MNKTTWTKYKQAARNQCFAGIPFQFGVNFSEAEIKEAKRLADRYEVGTDEERQERAFKEVRKQKNNRMAINLLGRATTVLPVRGETPIGTYRRRLIEAIQQHLRKHLEVLEGRSADAQLLRQFANANPRVPDDERVALIGPDRKRALAANPK